MIIKEKLVVLFDYKGETYDCLINRERDIETMTTDWTAEDIYVCNEEEETEHMPIFDIYGNLNEDGEPTTDNLEIYVLEYVVRKGYRTAALIKSDKIRVLECE